jgi:hypothetical protein
MRWVNRLRETRDDSGAIAVMAALLISVALLGIGAFVTDAGSWYAEKGQLQNGADSAALAVAQTCASQPTCSTSVAGSYANANANDGATTVDAVCGSGGGLSSCASNLCPAGSGTYVDVATETLTSSGSHLLPPIMANFLANESFSGKNITACAQASWSAAGSGGALAVTFSYCTWKTATSNGTAFAPTPPYTTWPPAVAGYTGTPPAVGAPGGEQVLMLHGSGNDCVGNAGSGWQLPGGFGWLVDTSPSPQTCTTAIDVANTYGDNTGVSAGASCVSVLNSDYANHTVVYLPIYDGMQGTGANGTYHLAGFGAFVITGGWINGTGGGFKQPSNITGKNYCNGSDRCIYGFFTKGLLPNGGEGGGSLPGVSVVTLTG